jgi:P27 family predicted phage terminase small subunit
MGRRGPPPKPTAQKKLEGNRGRRPLNAREPKPAAGAPTCPEWLPDDAKAEWRRVVPQLAKLKLLARIDLAALVCYCQAYADVQWATTEIEAMGRMYVGPNGAICAHPAVRMLAESSKRLRLFAAEFGLTPAARTRVQVSEEPDQDPLDEFLNSGKTSKPKT